MKNNRFNNSGLCFLKPTFAAWALSTSCTASKQKDENFWKAMTRGINRMGGMQHIHEQINGAITQWVHLRMIYFNKDKRLTMRERKAWHCPYALIDISFSYLYKTKDTQHSCQCLLFRASFHVQAFLFMPLPCWSRLHGFPQSFYLMCFHRSIHLHSAAQIKGQREIHQKELFKKRKRRRYKRCGSEQIRWLSNIGGKHKQMQKGHNEQAIWKEYLDLKKKKLA